MGAFGSALRRREVVRWTRSVLGTPNEAMQAQLGGGEPKLFTPWMTAHD
jgi:hypothetical protein